LEGRHDRTAFACGNERLDRYFQTQVTQDIRRRIANCFVTVATATGQVAAYYTIASASIPTPDLPAEDSKRLPRYPTLPAVRVGRLAVDHRYQGKGIGAVMLADAAQRAMTAAPASYALLVDAKDERAVAFYKHHGFRQLTGLPRVLFLPLATAEKLLLSFSA
jgi:GNAT superfamily N-acetyltransferase